MKRERVRAVQLWCCILALLLCWTAALASYGGLAGFSETVGLRYSADEGLTRRQVEESRAQSQKRKEAFPEITLWRERADQTVSGEVRRTDGARVLLFSGSGETVLPGRLQAGSYPAQDDAAGCAVGRQLATALWQTEEAAGNRLRYNGRTWIVRGVLNVEGAVLLLPAGADDTPFPCAELRFPGSGDPLADARAFLTRFSLPRPRAYADAPLAGQLGWLLLLLPGWLAAGWMLARAALRLWRVRENAVRSALWTAAALPSGILLLWCAQAGGTLPIRFIPSRWSDFSFWPALRDGAAENLRALLRAPLTARETELLARAGPLLLAGFAALLPLVPLLERIRIRSAGVLLAQAAVFPALLTGCLWLARPALPAGRAMWLVLPLCFVCDFLLYRLDRRTAGPRPAKRETVKTTMEGGRRR